MDLSFSLFRQLLLFLKSGIKNIICLTLPKVWSLRSFSSMLTSVMQWTERGKSKQNSWIVVWKINSLRTCGKVDMIGVNKGEQNHWNCHCFGSHLMLRWFDGRMRTCRRKRICFGVILLDWNGLFRQQWHVLWLDFIKDITKCQFRSYQMSGMDQA